jgi:cytochrome c551/c552
MALEEKAARRGTTLTDDVSSAATHAVAVEHGGPAATLVAQAPATAEEETVALDSGAESVWQRHPARLIGARRRG